MKAPKDKKIQVNLEFSLFKLIERVLFLGALFLLWQGYNSKKSQVNELKYLTEVQADAIKSYRNKNGEMVSTIKAFQTARIKDFQLLQTKDSSILRLQYLANKYKKMLKKQGSVTHIESSTNIDISTPNTSSKDSLNFPIYKSSFNKDNWIWGKIIAKKDTTDLELHFRNEYDIIVGNKKVGLFKYKPYVEVINRNPYSENKVLRSYQVSLPKQKWSLGLQAGYGITTKGLGGYVGIGINYKIF